MCSRGGARIENNEERLLTWTEVELSYLKKATFETSRMRKNWLRCGTCGLRIYHFEE